MITLLIADDIALNRKCLGMLLRRKGYRVLEANDGDQALEVTRDEHPDVAIVDLFMTAMDGFEYVRHIRDETAIAHTPVIFSSSTFSPDAAAVMARLLGVRHVLEKSSSEEEILAAIQEAVAAPQSLPVVIPEAEEFNREHARLISGKLTEHREEFLATLSDYLVDSE